MTGRALPAALRPSRAGHHYSDSEGEKKKRKQHKIDKNIYYVEMMITAKMQEPTMPSQLPGHKQILNKDLWGHLASAGRVLVSVAWGLGVL